MKNLTKAKIGTIALSAIAVTCTLKSEQYITAGAEKMNLTKTVIPPPATTEEHEAAPLNIIIEQMIEQAYIPEENLDCADHTRIDYSNSAVRRIMELPTYENGFLQALEEMCCRLDMHAHALLAVIHAETGGRFDPTIRNPSSSRATGLIQFVPRTAKALGTTIDEIREMGQIEQLPLIEEYYRRAAERRSPGVYREPIAVAMAVFIPAAIGRGWNYAVVDRAKSPTRYNLNSPMDLDEDGTITVYERSRRAFKFGYTTKADIYPWLRRREHRQQYR